MDLESLRHIQNPWMLLGLRCGQVVIFHLPGLGTNYEPQVEIGVVVGTWRGVKMPKMSADEVPVNSCVAFRAVSLDLVDEDWWIWWCSVSLRSFCNMCY